MTFKELSYLMLTLSSIPLWIAFILSVIVYKKLDPLHKSLRTYLFLMLVVDITSKVLGRVYNNNLILLPIFSFVELAFFIYFYNVYLLKKRNYVLMGIGLTGLMFIIAEFLQYFIFNTLDIKQFQPYAKVTDNFIIVLMALTFYLQKMNDFRETKWDNLRLNTVILIFFTLNAIMFLPYNFIINSTGDAKFYIWTINMIIMLLFYTYLAIAIWRNCRSKTVIRKT
jgi:hypothetical protein